MIDDTVSASEFETMLQKDDDWVMVDSQEMEDVDDRGQQRKDGAKDRLWPLSALREVHTRRLELLNFFQRFGCLDCVCFLALMLILSLMNFSVPKPFQYDSGVCIVTSPIFFLCASSGSL